MEKSKLTGVAYEIRDVLYITNIYQASAYIGAGGAEWLVDVRYDSSKESKRRLVFVFLKNDKTRELYEKWCNHELEY